MNSVDSEQQQIGLIPILARIWHEDDVWNVSAFDLPVVAYGSTVDDAKTNFEEATEAHFRALHDFGMLAGTVSTLREVVKERGFWEDRVRPHEMVQRFDLPALPLEDLCAVRV